MLCRFLTLPGSCCSCFQMSASRNPKGLNKRHCQLHRISKHGTVRFFRILEIGPHDEPHLLLKPLSYLTLYMHTHTHCISLIYANQTAFTTLKFSPQLHLSKDWLKHSSKFWVERISNFGQQRAKSHSCCQVSFPTYENFFTDATISNLGGWRSAATSQDMSVYPSPLRASFSYLATIATRKPRVLSRVAVFLSRLHQIFGIK